MPSNSHANRLFANRVLDRRIRVTDEEGFDKPDDGILTVATKTKDVGLLWISCNGGSESPFPQ